MKMCTQCKVEREETEFHSNGKKSGHSQCKACAKVYNQQYYRDNPEVAAARYKKRKEREKRDRSRIIDWILLKYEGVPCMDCGKVWPWCAMDFDHRPGEKKEFQIASKSGHKSTPERIAQIEKEIAKCDLVCASCHRVRTFISRS